MPASSEGHAAAETSAQSSPAIVVPGVATAVGSPAASEAVRHAAAAGSTPITGHAALGAVAGGRRGERADADGHERSTSYSACAAASANSVA